MRGPWEPGRPVRLHRQFRFGSPDHQSPDARDRASAVAGSKGPTRGWYRQAKATKRGEKDGRESERPIGSTRRGNRPSWTPWREGAAALWARRREPCEGIEPHQHVTVKASKPAEGRHHDVTSRMREIRKSGSVGASGKQSPEATRPGFSRGDPARDFPPRHLMNDYDIYFLDDQNSALYCEAIKCISARIKTCLNNSREMAR